MSELTVVIPTRGSSSELTSCIQTITRQCPPGLVGELIVVDDGSGHNFDHLLCSDGLPVRILRMSKQCGPGACRNAGVAASTSEWIAFVDDDCLIPWGWLTRIEKLTAVATPRLIGGRVRSRSRNNWWSQAMEDFVLNPTWQEDQWHVVTANCLVHREAWTAIGGFDTSFKTAGGEDWDFSRRIHAAGFPIEYDPALWCFHENATSPGPFFERAIRYGRAHAHWRVVERHRHPGHSTPASPRDARVGLIRRKASFLARRYRELRTRDASRTRSLRSSLLFAAFVGVFDVSALRESHRIRLAQQPADSNTQTNF